MAPSSAGTVGVRPPGATSFMAAARSVPTSEIRPMGTLGAAYPEGLQSRASSAPPLRLKKPMPARIPAAFGSWAKLCTAACKASQRVICEPLTARPMDCDRSMITNTSTGTASASTDTPLQASIALSPASPPCSSTPPAPPSAVLETMGRPLQASPEIGVLTVLELPLPPEVALAFPALPALFDLPALPVELVEPPLLERVPAFAFAWELGSMVLLCGSLHATATPTNSVAKAAMELERLRMFTSLHRRATVNNIDASRALALDATTGVAC